MSNVREVPGLYAALGDKAPDPTAGLSAMQRFAASVGLNTPFKRSIFVGAALTGLMWAIQPDSSFYQGEPRNWEDGGVPWYYIPLVGVIVTQIVT